MSRLLAFLALLLVLAAGPLATAATAASVETPVTTTITLTGSISAGRDYAGLFGPWGRNLAGKAFTATYTIVTFANSSVAPGVDLVSLGNTPLGPTTMTFGITINGRTRSGTANSFGFVEAHDGLGGAFAGGFDGVQTAAVQTLTSGADSQVFDLSATIESELHNIVSDNRSPNAMPSLSYAATDDDVAVGRFQFSQNSAPYVQSYGLLSISQVTVLSTPEIFPPVPEPGEWAMMLSGLAIAGFAGRRRRR